VGETLAECEACLKAQPDNHVRLLGLDNFANAQALQWLFTVAASEQLR